jgi:ABC-2 type transport system permease protein
LPTTIDAQELTKYFPSRGRLRDLARLRGRANTAPRPGTLAVDRATFQVQSGEIFGLLGPNGAGKTTLVKLLSTLILPSSGEAWIDGVPVHRADEVKASIGLMTANERSFFPRLTCRENLHFYGGLSRLPSGAVASKVAWLSEMLDLGGFLDKRYDRCSTGMKHRVALARALLNDASLLFLDEPTVTLDPVAAGQFRERLYALVHQERRTVFMVTHYVDEAVEMCDRVAIMLAGRVHLAGSPEGLRALLQSESRCELRIRGYSDALARRLAVLDEVETLEPRSQEGAGSGVERVTLHLRDRRRGLPGVVAAIEAGGGSLVALDLATTSWEQVAVRLAELAPTAQVPAQPAAAPLTGASRATSVDLPQRHTTSSAAERIRERLRLPPLALATPAAASQGVEISVSPAAREGIVALIRERVGLPPSPSPASARRLWLRLPALVWGHLRELALVVPLFLLRDLRTQASYRLSFVMEFGSILFSIASYFFMAKIFGMQDNPYLQTYGGDYFSFVLIGIAFLGYQSAALYSFSGVIQSAQSGGTLEAMLTTPTRLSAILFGSSAWNFVFTSFRVVLYLVAGALFFGARFDNANLLGALIILVFTVCSLGAIGIVSASFILVFKRGNPMNFFIGGASTLLGGVYYPIEVLPDWLQPVARLYPLATSLQAMRRALLTGASLADLLGEIGILVAFSIILLPLSLVVFNQAVRQAKRDGSLTQF